MPVKPSDAEEEFFKQKNVRDLRTARQEASKQMATDERERLKQQHWMRCPKCGMELAEVEHRSVMVDACFGCGGMFFDKGEVEKLGEQEEAGFVQGLFNNLFGG